MINGTFQFSGSGYFEFDEGHVFTQNAPFILGGSGQTHKIIQLNANANLNFTNNLVLRNGKVEYNNSAGINQNTGNLTLSNVLFEPANGVNVLHHQTAIKGQGLNNIAIGDCVFHDMWSALNIQGFAHMSVLHTTFEHLLHDNVVLKNGKTLKFGETQFINFGGDGSNGVYEKAITLEKIQDVTLEKTNISRDNTNVAVMDIGVALVDIPVFRFLNSSISNCVQGIKADIGKNNIDMKFNSSIHHCSVGILLSGERLNGVTNFGRFTMSCSSLDYNATGVLGDDIELNVDAGRNSGNSSNSFVIPSWANGNARGKLFHILYTYPIVNIRASNNYFPNGFYQGDNVWELPSGMSQTIGFVNLPYISGLIPTPLCVGRTAGGGGSGGIGTNPCDPSIDPTCLMGNDDPEVYMTLDGEIYNLKYQFKQAYEDFDYGETIDAYSKFEALSEISDEAYATASDICKKYIDVAKTMKKGDWQHRKGSRKSKWLPESRLQKNQTSATGLLILYPNPASDIAQLNLEWGEYSVRVVDATGRVVQNLETNGVHRFDVSQWAAGMYFVHIQNNKTNITQKAKIVVTH